MLLHRNDVNAAIHSVSGTLTSYPWTGSSSWSGGGAEMDDVANVEHTHLTIFEPDNQPTVGIHVDRITEHVH
jgi:hypothetical protein